MSRAGVRLLGSWNFKGFENSGGNCFAQSASLAAKEISRIPMSMISAYCVISI